MGSLYMLATPIGNLADLTERAKRLLASDAVLACEDTRTSRKLLHHLGVRAHLVSCRGQNSGVCVPRLLEQLASGRDVVYLTDAGTPGVSDPGAALVRAAREAGHTIVPVPGPSAVTALLSVSGIAGRGWYFEGFLAPKGAKRRNRLRELVARGDPFVLFESPYRVAKLADDLSVTAPEWQIVSGRELTKAFEQVVACSVAEFRRSIQAHAVPAKGEFAILVWPGVER